MEGLRSDSRHAAMISMPVSFTRGHRVSMSASLDQVREVWEAFLGFLKHHGVGERERWRWYQAMLELVNNAIIHGSGSDAAKRIQIEWWHAHDELNLVVEDSGKGPANSIVRRPRLPDDPTDQSGRGLYLVNAFCDHWDHWRSDRGYRSHIRKHLPLAKSATAQAEIAGTLESVGRSVSSLAAFYHLGAALLTQDQPALFIERGLEHLAASFELPPDDLKVILSSRIPSEIRQEIERHPFTIPVDQAPDIVRRVIEGGLGQDWNADTEPRPFGTAPGCGCCHPIVASGENLGCLLVSNQSSETMSFSDSAHTRIFADFFGIALSNYRLRKERDRQQGYLKESEIATRIQSDLLTFRHPPQSDRWDLFHRISSRGMVAGDYLEAGYDAEGNLIMTVIDVMGKGTSAAIFALIFRTALHMRLKAPFDLEAFVTSFNNTLFEWLGEDTRFISCVMAKVDPDFRGIEIVNAGHCPALMIENGEVSRQIAASGPPLGIFADSTYQSDTLDLKDGHGVIIVSDGVYEWLRDDQIWGWQRFLDFTKSHFQSGPESMWKALQEEIKQGVQDHDTLDDQALLWWHLKQGLPS